MNDLSAESVRPDSGAAVHCGACSQGQRFNADRTVCECRCHDHIADYVAWLTARAESYWNDARVLAEDGDEPMAVAYKTIAEELRRCAKEVGRGSP